MLELLHPAQAEALKKLRRLRVGAMYIERQEGKFRVVAELIRYRVETDRVDRVIWLCTRRKRDILQEGIARYLPAMQTQITLEGIESLSHNLNLFLRLEKAVEKERVMLVIDNGLLIKNPYTLRTQRVLKLCAECAYRLLISEVPLTKSAADMFTQWYALDWRILGYQSYWGFCVNHVGRYKRSMNMDYLARRIEPFCVQLLREDVQDVGGRKEYIWRFKLPDEVMKEYQIVVERFLAKAAYSTSGVYRLLQACQHVAGCRRIVRDYPLKTERMYSDTRDHPRITALLEVLAHFTKRKVLIFCRYRCECQDVEDALKQCYGEAQVRHYPSAHKKTDESAAWLTVMNSYANERESARLRAQVIVYYSSDWSWHKRQEKERRCQSALRDGDLTIVSLLAANTIDEKILRSIWNKDHLIRAMQNELATHQMKME